MSRRMLSVLGLSAVLTSPSPPVAAPGPPPRRRPAPRRRRAPSAAASAPAAPAGAACAESTHRRDVTVSIEDFAFDPAAITAKVGDTVTFTNGDSAGHTATLDDGRASRRPSPAGTSDGLTFTAAGTYPFHCAIHSTMKGTITVS